MRKYRPSFHLGQTLRLVESASDRPVVTDASEYRLAPIVAANVHILPVERLEQRVGMLPLYHLAARQKAESVALDEACQGFTRRRFLDLGLTPGTLIYPELPNPCATTIMTIYKKTTSRRWATLSWVITPELAFLVIFLTASLARYFTG